MIGSSPRPAVDRALLARLSRREPVRWLAAALLDWAIIVLVLVGARRVDHPVGYALAIVPLGSRQQALGALFHDAAHHLVSRRRALNDALGAPLSAWPLGLTLSGYRRYHLVHHRALGTPRDPEVGHKRLLPQWPLPMRNRHWLHFASDLVGGGLIHLAAAGRMTRPVRKRETLGFALFWVAAILIAYECGLLWALTLWVASIATAFWSGVRLRIWTEHLGTLGTHRITMGPLFEAVVMPHAIGLHWEHHHFPSVPFHRLRELREALPAPPIVGLGDLFRRFARSEPLASGDLGAPLGEPVSLTIDKRPTAGVP